jgi:malonyl-CoA O-methyltransferase
VSWAVKFFLDAFSWHVRTSFDAQAPLFPETIEDDDGRLRSLLEGLGDISGLRVLDGGCGKGRFARVLQEKFPTAEIWGVDISEAMLRHVPPAVRTRQGSLLNLPFGDGDFDCAYCVEALEHALNPESALAELCRVVKPTGRIVVIDKDMERLGTLATEVWERWFGRREVEQWLSRCCVEVRSHFIALAGTREPGGLFILWHGIRA